MPGITYQVGLYLGDGFCRGAALPGMPGVFMGQNNDVAWSFTNVMADVMDLFIERIDGDTYEFEGESRPLELIEEEIAVKRRSEPESTWWFARRTTARSSTRRCAPTSRAAGASLHGPRLSRDHAGEPWDARLLAAPTPGDSAHHAHPVSNLVWWTCARLIALKTVGRLPVRRGAAPTSRSPADGRVRMGWLGPLRAEMPEITDRTRASWSQPTTGSRPESYPTRLTQRLLDGYRASRSSAASCTTRHDLDSFAAIQTDMLLPGLRRLAGLAGCGREISASWRRSSACARGTGG
jgi:penicillin amidase